MILIATRDGKLCNYVLAFEEQPQQEDENVYSGVDDSTPTQNQGLCAKAVYDYQASKSNSYFIVGECKSIEIFKMAYRKVIALYIAFL